MNYFVILISLLLLVGVACNDTQPNKTSANTGIDDSFVKHIGHQVGGLSPNFEIPLTNGETLSSSSLLKSKTPIFIFFFSPF